MAKEVKDNLFIKDIDPFFSDTLMPVQFIEDSQVAAITQAKGIVLRLPESTGLLWDSLAFGEIEILQNDLVVNDDISIHIHHPGENMIQINLGNDLSAGDTITIRRLPVNNIVDSIYGERLDCSTNGDVSFNRTDTMGMSIGQIDIYSADQSFLLNDTTQAFSITFIQDTVLELMNQH